MANSAEDGMAAASLECVVAAQKVPGLVSCVSLRRRQAVRAEV